MNLRLVASKGVNTTTTNNGGFFIVSNKFVLYKVTNT
jgi:hypothetical protein